MTFTARIRVRLLLPSQVIGDPGVVSVYFLEMLKMTDVHGANVIQQGESR